MLEAVEKVLVDALLAADPLAELAAGLARETRLSDEERAWLVALDRDGFALASLLVKKLRFERITRGDAAHERRFEQDPRAFAELFQRYDREVAPRAFFPSDEADAFRDFVEREPR